MRPPQRQCEYFLIRYVPDPVKEEFVNVGVALYTLDKAGPQFCDLLFTKSWARATCLDPDFEAEEIQGLEQQIREAIWTCNPETVTSLRESFGGRVRLTNPRVVLTDSPEAELKLLQDAYLHRPRSGAKIANTGRDYILGRLRYEFQREGILQLLQERVPIAHFTHDGDPLKIDYAYRPSKRSGLVKMFQALSLDGDLHAAKALALSAPRIRESLRKDKSELELAAIIENKPPESREAEFGIQVMQENGIFIKTVGDASAIASQAREELTE